MIQETKTEYFNALLMWGRNKKTGKYVQVLHDGYWHNDKKYLVMDPPVYSLQSFGYESRNVKLRVSLKRTRHARKFRMLKDGYNRYLTDQKGDFEKTHDCLLLRHEISPAFPELEDEDIVVWVEIREKP